MELQQYKDSNEISKDRGLFNLNFAKLSDASDEQIKNALRGIMLLIGISSDAVPKTEAEKALIIFNLKRCYPNLTVGELFKAFELAIANKFTTELNLYNRPLSVLYLTRVINDYVIYKNRLQEKENKVEGMHNTERAKSIFSFLSKETLDAIDNFGKKYSKEIEKEIKVKEDNYQKWFKHFDFLYKKFAIEGISPRYIKRYGKPLNQLDYCEFKRKQLILINQYYDNKKD